MSNDELARGEEQNATGNGSVDEAPNTTDVEESATPDSSESPGSEPGEPFDELAALNERVTQLESEIADLTDQLLRKSADFENYRKRVIRERESIVAEANRALLLDIVEIIDNFERAIRSADESQDFTA